MGIRVFPPATAGSWHVQTFTSSGTFTVPAGVTSVLVFARGGGGGGGGGENSSSGGSGGGQGGFQQVLQAVTPGQVLTVTIGAGGTPGTTAFSPTVGGNGGNTTVTGTGVSITAGGGGGGLEQNSPQPWEGAAGSGTSSNTGGYRGGKPMTVSGFLAGGNGGGYGGGNGADMYATGTSTPATSGAANTGGGGGGGSADPQSPSAGGSGYVELRWFG